VNMTVWLRGRVSEATVLFCIALSGCSGKVVGTAAATDGSVEGGDDGPESESGAGLPGICTGPIPACGGCCTNGNCVLGTDDTACGIANSECTDCTLSTDVCNVKKPGTPPVGALCLPP
jgi:hypothetical protein